MKSNAAPPLPVCSLPHDDALAPLLERLMRYARSKLRNDAMAEDAVAETLLAALETPCDFDSPTRTSAWLFGVLKHKLVDQLRKTHREQPAGDMSVECDHADLTWSGAWSDSGGRAHDPERAFAQRQLMALLARACAALPPTQARAFQMREVLDMDTGAICDCLGINQGHLWVLTHRARRHLRQELVRHGAASAD
jgi:RNA polymerase sigma-70 factor (TIGR02943 family)